MTKKAKTPRPKGQYGKRARSKGFVRAIGLMEHSIRDAGAKRGFSVARLLTHWDDIVGAELAAICVPLKVGYGSGGIGAAMTLLVEGAHAPIIEMQKDAIRDKVNACYGYNAITRIVITQTAPTGFAAGETRFRPTPKPRPPEPSAAQTARAQEQTQGIQDDDLRASLARLAANLLAKSEQKNALPAKSKPHIATGATHERRVTKI